jgi:dTDP-4-dehydrorhamnose 3,5-epimerase
VDFTPTALPDVLLIHSHERGDERGYLLETYRSAEFAAAGITLPFVQENHSSSRQGVLRGLHYQVRRAQGKLVRAARGAIYDVAVDLRRSSPTFAGWVGIALSAENHLQLWIPPGFAHGFFVMSESAEVIYKMTDYYAQEFERTLRWDDPRLGVAWPLPKGGLPMLSPRDAAGQLLDEADLFD